MKKFFNNVKKDTVNPLMSYVYPDELYGVISKLISNKATDGKIDLLDIGGGRGKTFNSNKVNYYVLDLNSHNDEFFIQGDITDENLEIDRIFDVIITKDTFEHILNPWDSVENIKNLLKEGGIFICIAPFSWRFHPSPYDCYRYSHQGLKFMFEHKGQMQELDSGYVYYYNHVKGFWKNKCDFWPFSNNNYNDCVCAYYIGVKDNNKKFDLSDIKGDFSLKHDKVPE